MSDTELFTSLEKILKEQNTPDEDIKEVYEAFKFADELHKGQYRVSEEPYIIHPVEVAKILATLRVDKHTLMAAMLHDTIEDTGITPEVIQEKFGEDVLNLVLGITKLDYIVGTHPHADHIGGLDNVINEFDIGTIYMPNIQTNTKTFEDVLDAIAGKNKKIFQSIRNEKNF